MRSFTLRLLVVLAVVGAGAQPAGALGNPSLGASKCVAAKIKCVVKKKSCLLGCWKKAVGKTVPVDSGCLAKCHDKFDGGAAPEKGCFAKLEAKAGNDCGASVGDTAAAEAKVDAFVQDLVAELATASTPSTQKCAAGKIGCAAKYDACVLGLFSKAAGAGGAIDGSKLTKCRDKLAACFSKLEAKPPCLTDGDVFAIRNKDEAFIDDVVAELATGPNDLHNRRCTNDTSIRCTTNAPCAGGGGTCEYWFGSLLPMSYGGVSFCGSQQWNGAITGTFDQQAGTIAADASLRLRLYSGSGVATPCPRCMNDPFPNDGVAGGLCTGGTRNGLGCDANGQTAEPAFGVTSLDCPPSGLPAANSVFGLAATTGTAVGAVTALSPTCNGSPGDLCLCNSCSGNAAVACRNDAECALAGVGTCTNNVGEPRRPNNCYDDSFNPADGTICAVKPDGSGECPEGPIFQRCAIETFRSCTVPNEAVDCPAPGDSCDFMPAPCFAGYNGNLGDSITVSGAAGPPRNHAGTPTLASVYCLPPTGIAFVNVIGLPGPGTMRLAGVSADNGSSGACPTVASFMPTSKGGAIDRGWQGLGHDQRMVSNAKVSVAVAGCANGPPNCGVCSFLGPILNPNANP